MSCVLRVVDYKLRIANLGIADSPHPALSPEGRGER
jgi:hypothetical protein